MYKLVWATVPDRRFECGSGSEPTPFQIGGPCRRYSRTINLGMVRLTSHNSSELGGLPVGCPAGPSVDSYNAHVFAIS